MILNLSGGGGSAASLNFKVVGGTTQPASARENTIWINTDSEITGWALSPNELADPAEGLVWITTGSYAATQFNALKKNGIIIYPVSAFQYIDGVWVDKPAQIYQEGTWKDWLFYIFKEGYGLCNNYTGFTNATSTTELLTLKIITTNGTTESLSNEVIDVTNFKTVTFEGVTAKWSGTGAYSHRMRLLAGSAYVLIGQGNDDEFPDHVMCTDETFTIDLSEVEGEINIGASYYCSDDDSSTATITIRNIFFC